MGTRTNGRTKNPQELYLCNSDNFSERKSETLHVYISKSSTVYTCTVNQAFIFIYNVYISHLTYSKVKTMAVKYQTLPIKYQTLPIKYQIQLLEQLLHFHEELHSVTGSFFAVAL